MSDNGLKKLCMSLAAGVIILLIFILVLFGNLNRQQSSNRKLQTELTAAKKNTKAVKKDQVKKYSSSYLKSTSTNIENNVLGFFSAMNNWDADQYAARYTNAAKYATSDVISQYTGGGQMSQSDLQAKQKQMEDSNTSSKLVNAKFYQANSDGTTVDGLIIYSTQSINDGTAAMSTTQIKTVTYDVLSGKITKIGSLSTNS